MACANILCAKGCLGACKPLPMTGADIRMFDAALFRSVEIIHPGTVAEPRHEICGELEDGA